MAYLDDLYYTLNIQPSTSVPLFVRLSQNENGRRLYFALAGIDGNVPSGTTVTISGTKPDGVVYSATGSITNNMALITEDVQMTAVPGTWDAKLKLTSGGQTIASGRIRFVIDTDTVDPSAVPSDSQLNGLVAEAENYAGSAKIYAENARAEAYGSPLVASTVASMVDHDRVYVYVGSESGYTSGNWYYWNGTAWTSGGVYNNTAVPDDLFGEIVRFSETEPIEEKTRIWISEDQEEIEIPTFEDIESGNMNQLVRIAPFVTGNGKGKLHALRSTLSMTGNTLQANWKGSSVSFGFYTDIEDTQAGQNAGHKIYYNIHGAQQSCLSFVRFRLQFWSNGSSIGTNIDFSGPNVEGVEELSGNAGQIALLCSSGASTSDYFTLEYVQFIDLTRMFGAGNEPSLELFKEIYGDGIPYAFRSPSGFDSLKEEKTLFKIMSVDFFKYLGSQSSLNYTSFADITNTGYFNFVSSRVDDFSDKPVDLINGGICSNYNTSAGRFQILQSVGNIWFRNITSSGGASQWRSLVKPYDVKWYALGDSLTYGTYSEIGSATGVGRTNDNYVALVSQYNGYTVTNLGEGGMGYLHAGNTTSKTAKNIVDDNSFSDADLVTLAFGINDWGHFNFGTADDAITANTVCGAMKYCIEKIMEKCPTCKIVVITPFNCFRHGGTYETNWALGYDRGYGTLQNLIDAIKSVCDFYGVQYLEMTKIGPVNRQNIATLLGDGLHPTIDGYAVIAKTIRKAVPI